MTTDSESNETPEVDEDNGLDESVEENGAGEKGQAISPELSSAVFIKNTIRLLIALYIVIVLAFGFWYWIRPVREVQITHAYETWYEIAVIYNIPLPKAETWHDNQSIEWFHEMDE